MLATLVAEAPTGDRWLHEIKFDGYRLQAHVVDGRVRLRTRSGLDWTDRFGGALAKELADLAVSTAIIDGELVSETSLGASDFSALQTDLGEGRTDRMAFCVFDLLYLDGHDLRGVALERRKAALKQLMPEKVSLLRYSEHFADNGDMVLRHACRLSLEGVVSKARDAPLSLRSRQVLGEIKMLLTPGVRHWRLYAVQRDGRRRGFPRPGRP